MIEISITFRYPFALIRAMASDVPTVSNTVPAVSIIVPNGYREKDGKMVRLFPGVPVPLIYGGDNDFYVPGPPLRKQHRDTIASYSRKVEPEDIPESGDTPRCAICALKRDHSGEHAFMTYTIEEPTVYVPPARQVYVLRSGSCASK